MKTLRFLIAEDVAEDRRIIVNHLNEYFIAYPASHNIEMADSFVSALQKLEESRKTGAYYDIFFSDIDFQEDTKGGERDSGFSLIRIAFEICPATLIVTYSGEFEKSDLYTQHEDFRDKGLVVRSMNKSHSNSGDHIWMLEQIRKIVSIARKNRVTHDLWRNILSINRKLERISLGQNERTNSRRKSSIKTKLQSAFVLQKNLTRIEEKSVFYRLMIYLYHSSLEMYLRGERNDQELLDTAEAKKDECIQILRTNGVDNNINWDFSKCNALPVFIASAPKIIFYYTYILNWYRNKSIHDDNEFKLNPANAFFAHLTLAACILEPSEIAFREIEYYIKSQKGIDPDSRRKFDSLLNYLKS